MIKNNSDKIYFFDIDGKLIKEEIEGEFFLRFLYTTFWGRILRFVFNKKFVCQIYAFFQRSFLSKYKIKPFVEKHKIDLSELEKELEQFSSFNDFFIRELKSNARQINKDPNVVISPADSKLFVVPNISENVSFFVKNQKFNLKKFLGYEHLAGWYENGNLMVFRLAPYDCHRFHFPIDCVPLKAKKINGRYESVNPLAYKAGIQPLVENERQIVVLKSEKFSDVVMVVVGAMLVGKINFTFHEGHHYKKGQEMGYFEFGGSSVALLFKKGITKPKQEFVEHSLRDFETAIKIGQAITQD